MKPRENKRECEKVPHISPRNTTNNIFSPLFYMLIFLQLYRITIVRDTAT